MRDEILKNEHSLRDYLYLCKKYVIFDVSLYSHIDLI